MWPHPFEWRCGGLRWKLSELCPHAQSIKIPSWERTISKRLCFKVVKMIIFFIFISSWPSVQLWMWYNQWQIHMLWGHCSPTEFELSIFIVLCGDALQPTLLPCPLPHTPLHSSPSFWETQKLNSGVNLLVQCTRHVSNKVAFRGQLAEKRWLKEMARKDRVHRGLVRKTEVLKKEIKWLY